MRVKNRTDFLKDIELFSSLPHGGYTEPLYNCKATIIHPDFSDFIILRSYATIVAVFQYSTGILWTFGFYSHTTAQHIAKFSNWLKSVSFNYSHFPRRVNLYNDSHTGKCAARKNLDDDFASVIATAINQS